MALQWYAVKQRIYAPWGYCWAWFANVPARTWAINAVDTIVAGVYGRASNSGTAPAFGGFFYDLFAGGLILVESVLQERRITHGI